jgi:ABC-type branched-subunit amino acid transport system substrate-binding protein
MLKSHAKGLIAIMFIIAIVTFSGCTDTTDADTDTDTVEQEEVKIGTLLSITGDLSPYGGPMENAAKLAIEEVNANGGLLGTQVTMINEDSQTCSCNHRGSR